MKRKRIYITILLMLSAFALTCTGCSLFKQVEYITDWSAQYDEDDNSIQAFFGLQDKDKNYLSSDAAVNVRIEDDNGNNLYEDVWNITESDFGSFTNPTKGERYLACIYIPIDEITPGTSTGGNVYLTVTKDNAFTFEEVKAELLDGLPIQNIDLEVQEEPIVVNYSFPYLGTNTYELSDINYTWNTDLMPYLEIEVTIAEIKGNANLSSGMIGYKIYDEDDYIVDSGTILCSEIGIGEKSKEQIEVYDLTPGEHYKLKFEEY